MLQPAEPSQSLSRHQNSHRGSAPFTGHHALTDGDQPVVEEHGTSAVSRLNRNVGEQGGSVGAVLDGDDTPFVRMSVRRCGAIHLDGLARCQLKGSPGYDRSDGGVDATVVHSNDGHVIPFECLARDEAYSTTEHAPHLYTSTGVLLQCSHHMLGHQERQRLSVEGDAGAAILSVLGED